MVMTAAPRGQDDGDVGPVAVGTAFSEGFEAMDCPSRGWTMAPRRTSGLLDPDVSSAGRGGDGANDGLPPAA